MTKTDEIVAAARRAQVRYEQREAGCTHSALVKFDEKYDAFWCRECDIWLEPLCDDAECPFCTLVPLRPSLR